MATLIRSNMISSSRARDIKLHVFGHWRGRADCVAFDQSYRAAVSEKPDQNGNDGPRQAEQLYASAVEGIGDIVAEAQQEIGAAPAKTLANGNGSQAA